MSNKERRFRGFNFAESGVKTDIAIAVFFASTAIAAWAYAGYSMGQKQDLLAAVFVGIGAFSLVGLNQHLTIIGLKHENARLKKMLGKK